MQGLATEQGLSTPTLAGACIILCKAINLRMLPHYLNIEVCFYFDWIATIAI